MTAQIRKNTWVMFGVFAAMGFFIAGAAYFEWGRPLLRFLWSRPFLMFLKVLLAAALFLSVLKWFFQKSLPLKWLKWVYGILFLPVLLLPLFRCYFKVPYVFCRACPHPCPWGILRSAAFPAFLLLNLSNRFWCVALCPLGSCQECQAQIPNKRFGFPPWVRSFAYILLLLVTGMYLLTLFGSPWVEFFDVGRYAWVETTAWAFLVIFAVCFFIPLFWCRYFCPVGTIHDLASSFRSKSSHAHKESV